MAKPPQKMKKEVKKKSVKKAPSAPSFKGTKEDRWGTPRMSPREKMEFGNMVLDHQAAERKKSGRVAVTKKKKF